MCSSSIALIISDMSVQLFSQGLLAQVWLFAHCPQRLSRLQVLAFPISDSVSVLKGCKTVVALRIAAQLLIGVVRLYVGQVDLALEELAEAMGQIGRTVEHVLVRETAEIPLKARKNSIVAIKRTEFSTYLQPAQETHMEIVACSEEITINEANYKVNPLPTPIKSDHISTSSTFLEDLIDEEFRIDPIQPKLPAALPSSEPETVPEAVPETLPALQEAEEEPANVMDLDWSVREEPTSTKKKRPKREKAEKAVNLQEEDEVILPSEPTEEEETSILAFSQSQNPPDSLPPVSTPILEPPRRGFRKLSKGWSPDTGSLLIDYESIAHLDCTGDIVRVPTFEQKSPSKLHLEKLLYESLVEGMTKELADWFTSSHKVLLVKNAIRETEEPEVPSIAPIPTKRERAPVLSVPPVVSYDPEPTIPILKFETLDSPSPEQLSERSVKMLQLLGNRLKGKKKLRFSDLAAGKGAHTRACGFFELLVLTKRRLIAIEQTEGWGEIEISLESRE